MEYFYTTLSKAKTEQKSINTQDDNYILASIAIVSARIDELLQGNIPNRRPYFLPYKETREIVLSTQNIQPRYNALLMPYFILALTSVGINGTDITSNARLYPPTYIPTKQIQLNSTTNWLNYCTASDAYSTNYATIAGVWGYNSDYTNAWQSVDVITVAGINSSVTSFTVADVDGVDVYGVTPRISAGNYILIDSEVMLVTATNTTTNTVTVKRGVLGTTASAHLVGASVSTYEVEPTIGRVVNRQVGAMYARRGAYDAITIETAGVVTYPPDLLPELENVVTIYAGAY